MEPQTKEGISVGSESWTQDFHVSSKFKVSWFWVYLFIIFLLNCDLTQKIYYLFVITFLGLGIRQKIRFKNYGKKRVAESNFVPWNLELRWFKLWILGMPMYPTLDFTNYFLKTFKVLIVNKCLEMQNGINKCLQERFL